MRRILTIFALTACITGTAWAEDQSVTDEMTPTTTAGAEEVTRGYLRSEVVGIKPQAGLLLMTDQTGSSTGRAMYGLTADANFATAINKDWSYLFIGPSVGLLYSHLGDPGSNLLGTNASLTAGSAGANLLVIPANLKVGYNITDNFRLSAHGGGNVVYRSVGTSLYLGDATPTAGATWKMLPNVGADAEFGFGNRLALMLRPDWTLASGTSFFTGTVALAIPLG